MKLTVTAEAEVKPTEDEEKVRRALLNIFPGASIERIERDGGRVMLRAHGTELGFLATLRNLIKQERIRSAARKILLANSRPACIRVLLNKQAAFVGRISFCEHMNESPNGPIAVEIRGEDLERVVDYLAARPGDRSYYSGEM